VAAVGGPPCLVGVPYAAGMRPPFIDHLTLTVRDLDASRAFYERALEPFGVHTAEIDGRDGPEVAIGPEGSEDLVLRGGEPAAPVHVAFLAHDTETVDAFHAAALEAGGRDNGEPGRRPHYHERYYAAYVLDPDGNNVEAVSHLGPTKDEKEPGGNEAVTPEDPR
jgi:catechol 2,3-dioxygenase-like lactoylglutathione lyase family enzyme